MSTNLNNYRNNIKAHIKNQVNDWMNAPANINRQNYYQIPVVASTLIIPRSGKIREFDEEINNEPWLALEVSNANGEKRKIRTVKDEFNFDAVIVHFRDKIRVQYFADEQYKNVPHLTQSVAKSMIGTCYSIAVDKGLIDPNKFLHEYLPELNGSVYEDATVQHLADMRVNMPFNDFYSLNNDRLATGDSLELMELSRSTMYSGWKSDVPIMDFVHKLLKKTDQGLINGHGSNFNYMSLDTILMTLLIEEVTDEPFHRFFEREIYAKIGAANDGLFTINNFGESTGGEGGMCFTAMDMLRFAKAVQEQIFDSPYLYQRINGLQKDSEIHTGQINMKEYRDYIQVYGEFGIHHYSNYYYLATNPYNQVRMNFMLGIYGQVTAYSLEDDFVYVGQSSYNLTTAPPIIAHAEAAYQLHNQYINEDL